MNIQTATRPAVLRTALKTNAAFSLLSGLALTFASGPLARYMGFDRPALLIVVGVMLLIFAADVYWVASRPEIDLRWAKVIFGADIAWILGSALLLITGLAGFNAAGRWLVVILADIVAVFAVWQGIGIWKTK